MIRQLLTILLTALPLVWACGPLPEDGSGDEDDDETSDIEECGADVDDALDDIAGWTVVSCGDIHLATANDAENVSISLSVFVDTDDYEVGDVFVTEPVWPAGFLWLETGTNLLGYDCTDILTEEQLDRRWEAMSGTVRVTMLEVESGVDEVQVEIRDVVVGDPADGTSGCELPDVTWTDLQVGWLAGGA